MRCRRVLASSRKLRRSGSGSSSSSSGSTNSDGSDLGYASDSMSSSDSSAGGTDERDGYVGNTNDAVLPKKAERKRALIRQFRLEFAKTLTIETANKLPLRALSADVYLDQFSKELDAGLNQQADVNSLGSDLGLLRNSLNHRLDKVIAGSCQILRPPKNNEAQKFSCQLTTFFVAPWARGHGLARMIVAEAEAFAKSEGFLIINLDVRATQARAIQSFESRDFKCYAKNDHYAMVGGNYVTGLYYHKEL